MIVDWAHGATEQDLSPARSGTTPPVPVYPDIAAALAVPEPDPAAPVPSFAPAHILATCAAYSYSDEANTVATIMARMGLTGNRCLKLSEDVDALLITSTAYLVQSADGRIVLLSYRGTRATQLIDFFGDVDSTPERLRVPLPGSPGQYELHAGFYRNVRATRAAVLAALQRALEGRPIIPPPTEGADPPPPSLHPMEALYITGHSLGGAMAALMGVLLAAETDPLRREIAARMRAVHTFGQPMVGTPEFAAAAVRVPWPADGTPLADHLTRWVYRHDVVAGFPSTAFGRFGHFGRERRFRPERGWVVPPRPSGQQESLLALVYSVGSIIARSFALTRGLWWGPSIADHLPEHYLTHLAPAGVTSEYGD